MDNSDGIGLEEGDVSLKMARDVLFDVSDFAAHEVTWELVGYIQKRATCIYFLADTKEFSTCNSNFDSDTQDW